MRQSPDRRPRAEQKSLPSVALVSEFTRLCGNTFPLWEMVSELNALANARLLDAQRALLTATLETQTRLGAPPENSEGAEDTRRIETLLSLLSENVLDIEPNTGKENFSVAIHRVNSLAQHSGWNDDAMKDTIRRAAELLKRP